jgi:hypothetical protein
VELLLWPPFKNSWCHVAAVQVRDNPIWFVAFVWCEVVIQLPFFLVAAYAYLRGEFGLGL